MHMLIKMTFYHLVQLSSIPYFDKNHKINEKYYIWSVLKICKPDPGLLNITLASDMPITSYHIAPSDAYK